MIAAITLLGAFFFPWVTNFITLSGYELTREYYRFEQGEFVIFAAVPVGALFSILLCKFRIGPIITILLSTLGIFVMMAGSTDYELEIGVYVSFVALIVLFVSLFMSSKKTEKDVQVVPNKQHAVTPQPLQDPVVPSTNANEAFCTECGTKLESDSKYCTDCGVKLVG